MKKIVFLLAIIINAPIFSTEEGTCPSSIAKPGGIIASTQNILQKIFEKTKNRSFEVGVNTVDYGEVGFPLQEESYKKLLEGGSLLGASISDDPKKLEPIFKYLYEQTDAINKESKQKYLLGQSMTIIPKRTLDNFRVTQSFTSEEIEKRNKNMTFIEKVNDNEVKAKKSIAGGLFSMVFNLKAFELDKNQKAVNSPFNADSMQFFGDQVRCQQTPMDPNLSIPNPDYVKISYVTPGSNPISNGGSGLSCFYQLDQEHILRVNYGITGIKKNFTTKFYADSKKVDTMKKEMASEMKTWNID